MKKRMKKSTEWNDIESPSNDLRPIKTKKSIKQLIPLVSGLSFIGISGLLVATSVGLSVPNSVISPNLNGKLLFDDKVFKNKEELLAYAQQNYFQRTDTVENRFNWSIDERGEKVYFNDPKLLRNHLLNNIKQTSALSSKKFNENEGGLGEVNPRDFAHLYFNQTEESLQSTIYRGKNNSIHDTIEKAKDSYLSIHDAYYFNNIYFNNIQQLKLYLQTVYYVPGGDGYNNSSKPENIGLVGPSGIISAPMNTHDLFNLEIGNEKSIQTKKDFMNNIGNQAEKYIEFQDVNGKYFYANEKDLDNPGDKLLSSFNPEYTMQYTNEGKGTYVVDLHKDDPFTLFGPYYLQTSGKISAINDTKQWNKVESNDPLISVEQNSTNISTLLNIILFPDDTDEGASFDKRSPINIKYLNKSTIQPFIEKLSEKNNDVYHEWMSFSEIIKSGKRSNTFFNLPIFYFWLIENLVNDNASQEVIIMAKNMFNDIAKYIDQTIKILIPSNLLLKDGSNNEYLSFEKIFDFNSNDIDSNSSIYYFIKEISDNYSQFIVAINVISQANLNAMYSGGTLPYRADFIRHILGINSSTVLPQYSKSYEKLWTIFSSYNINDLKAELIKESFYAGDISNVFMDDLILSLSVTNSIFSIASKSLFEDNFKNIEIRVTNNQISVTKDPYNLMRPFEYSSGTGYSSIVKKLYDARETLTWENFMLIKFAFNSREANWSNINFKDDEVLLNANLLRSIENISLKSYATNFIIEPKITENLISISSLVEEGFKNFENNFKKMTNTIDSVKGKLDNILINMTNTFKFLGENEIWNSEKALDILKKISSSKVLSTISSAIPYLQGGLIALDLINNIFIPQTQYFSYKFELEDQSFIWNGGKSTTMFFGFIETASTTINDMKLLEPQNVVKPRVKTSLYFNGTQYSPTNLDSLKKDQLKAILRGEFRSNNIRNVYTFDSLNISENINPSEFRNSLAFYKFGTIDDLKIALKPEDEPTLIQYVYQSIHDALLAGTNPHHGKKYYKGSFVFANGVVVDAADANDSQVIRQHIENIMNNIEPVKIATLPRMINGKPTYNNDGNKEDFSIPEYVLPSLSWSSSFFSTNRTQNNYIIFDPNQKGEAGVRITDDEAKRSVTKLFHEYFDVDSKSVIKTEIETNNVFSELNPSITTYVIFEVKLENNLTKYFFDESSAFKWILSQKNFTLYSYTTTIDIYKYQDRLFNSRDEFINFILKEAVVEVN